MIPSRSGVSNPTTYREQPKPGAHEPGMASYMLSIRRLYKRYGNEPPLFSQ